MDLFLNNIQLGLRGLFRAPLFSLWVILALGLGIGANTAVFSAVYAIFLNLVDYKDPQALVVILDRDKEGVELRASAGNFADWREKAQSFSSLAGYTRTPFVMTGADTPRRLLGAAVTDNFFTTLGVQPILGRTFQAGEDGVTRPGSAANVAVISYRIWQDVFGGAPTVLERKIQLNGLSHSIIGVMPADFFQLEESREVWVPLSINRTDRDFHSILAIGRLKVAPERASAEMSALAAQLGREYPASNGGWSTTQSRLLDWTFRGSYRTVRALVLILFGAVGMVLLIACINVAGLLLTRAVSRHKEMALRVALGAPRSALIHQLLIESLLLSAGGALLGLVVAWFLVHAIPTLAPPNLLRITEHIQWNWWVACFALGLAALTGILCGLVPAFAGSRQDVISALKDSSRGSTTGKGNQRVRQFMVVLQIGVALMLLASAVLMTESLLTSIRVYPGFEVKETVATRLNLPRSQYERPRALALQRDLLARLQALPGVQSAALGSSLPLATVDEVPFEPDGQTERPMAERPTVGYITVTPGYLAALRIPLRAGRFIADTDRENTPPVVLVNDAYVKRYSAGKNPLGQYLQINRPVFGKNEFEATLRAEIVGVVGDVRLGTRAPEPQPTVYAAQEQNLWAEYPWIVLRATGGAGAVGGALRRTINEMDSGLSTGAVSSLEQRFADQFSQPQFQVRLMSFFAGLALLLAAIGIYGMQSHLVAARKNEIGLRMAVGASPSSVMRNVLGQGMRLTAAGIVAGLAGAFSAASAIRSVLVGISATDTRTLIFVSIVLALVSLAACYFPARRAMRLDPATVLREE